MKFLIYFYSAKKFLLQFLYVYTGFFRDKYKIQKPVFNTKYRVLRYEWQMTKIANCTRLTKTVTKDLRNSVAITV